MDAAEPGSGSPLADRFHLAFQGVQRQLREQLQRQLQEDDRYNLTRGQFFLLRYLYRQTALTISDLSEWMNVKPATMSPIIDRLEKNRLVSRIRDSKDRRTVYVHLTEEGARIVQQAEQAWRSALSGQLSRLTEQEQLMLVELLERLNASEQSEPSGGDTENE